MLGGLLGCPKALPCYLLGSFQPLLGRPLGHLHTLPKVGEGREEVPVGLRPGPAERPESLLLLAYSPREDLGGAHVLLGLLPQRLYGLARPALHELGVLLLELEQRNATREPLLDRPDALLLPPHELEPAFGNPHGAALGGS